MKNKKPISIPLPHIFGLRMKNFFAYDIINSRTAWRWPNFPVIVLSLFFSCNITDLGINSYEYQQQLFCNFKTYKFDLLYVKIINFLVSFVKNHCKWFVWKLKSLVFFGAFIFFHLLKSLWLQKNHS